MLHFTQTNRELPTLLLLHPAGFDGRVWTDVAELLPDFNCVCVDLPGHGRSKKLSLTTFEDACDAVALVLEHLGSKPVHIAGLSMGSYVGFNLMKRHPALVESAVLSGFQHEPIPTSFFMRATMHVSSWMINSKKNREKMARSLGVSNASLASTGGLPNASAATMRQAARLALEFDTRADMDHIKSRTLVLAGEKEHPAIKASMPVFQSKLPRCEARSIPELGHGWLAQAPDLFAETVRAWVTCQALPEKLEPLTETH